METIIKTFNELTINELYDIFKARIDVFVVEQECAYPEIDDIDKRSVHVFIKDEDKLVAYLRVFEKIGANDTAQIGRVLTLQRKKNLGSQVMKAGIEVAKNNLNAKSIYIEAQSYAIGFYEKFGFHTSSEPFLEDGIEHVQMTLNLEKKN